MRPGTGDSNFTGRNSRRSAVGDGVGAHTVGGGGGVGAGDLADASGVEADGALFLRCSVGVVLGDQMPAMEWIWCFVGVNGECD